jgi:hypothetical protein
MSTTAVPTRTDSILLLMERADETGIGVREAIAATVATGVPQVVALAVLLGLFPIGVAGMALASVAQAVRR